MTTYLSAKREFRRRSLKYLAMALLLGVVLFVWPALRASLLSVTDPLVSGYVYLSSGVRNVYGTVSTFFTYKTTLRDYTASLEAENELLFNEVTLLRRELEEGSMSSSTEHIVGDAIVAHPIFVGARHLYATLRVNRGFKDGASVGMLVYVRGMYAIGEVENVANTTSLVRLFTQDEEVTAVSSRTGMLLTLRGVGGGSFSVTLPKDVDLQVGDTLSFAEDRRFILGSVVQREGEQEDVTYTYLIAGGYNKPAIHTLYLVERE